MAEINEAIAKWAEEKAGGLALDDPLEVIRAGRENIGTARRSIWSWITEDLTPDQQRAAIWIGKGHRTTCAVMECAATAKTANLIGIGGKAMPDAINEQTEYMIAYSSWRVELITRPRIVDSCINVFAKGMTLRQASGAVSDKTVKSHCITGCKEFVRLMAPKRIRRNRISFIGERPSKTVPD